MPTATIRPLASLNSAWSTFAATSIDDAVTQPTAGSGDVCSVAGNTTAAQQWSLDLPTATGVITSVVLWVRSKSDGNTDGDISAVRIRLNGTWYSGTLNTTNSGGTYSWRSATFTGSYGTHVGSVPAFELTYTGTTVDATLDVDVVYAVVTYSSYPSVSGAPVVQSSATTDYSADQTTHVINLPSGISAGDLLAVWFCRDGTTGTVTTPSGWTATLGPLTQTDMSHLFTKTASGSEGSTLSITTSVSESSAAVAVRVSGFTSIVAASFTTASNLLFANPPAVTATGTVGAVLMAFGSAIGSNFVAEEANGPVPFTFANGNTANAGNTVCAFGQWATCAVTNNEQPIVLPYRWSTATTYRGASLLVQGSAASSGSSVKVTRAMNGGYNS